MCQITRHSDAKTGLHLKCTIDDKLPLVERGVPVHLPQAAGGELYQRAAHCGGRRKRGLVGDNQVAASVVDLQAQARSRGTAVILQALAWQTEEQSKGVLYERHPHGFWLPVWHQTIERQHAAWGRCIQVNACQCMRPSFPAGLHCAQAGWEDALK